MDLSWEQPSPGNIECVITGCDSTTAWMLPWWWSNYSKYNATPVVFADFGMRDNDREWCESHGRVLTIGGRFKCNWFKKPFAILKCDYRRILWLDSDCEIRGDISPILQACVPDPGFAGVIDPYTKSKTNDTINTGVLAIRNGNQLVVDWASRCLRDSEKFRGDQEVLGAMLDTDRTNISILHPTYNRLRLAGDNGDALVMHWTGMPGKTRIRQMMQEMMGAPVRPIARRELPPIVRQKLVPKPNKVLQPKQLVLRPKQQATMPLTAMQQRGIRKPI